MKRSSSPCFLVSMRNSPKARGESSFKPVRGRDSQRGVNKSRTKPICSRCVPQGGSGAGVRAPYPVPRKLFNLEPAFRGAGMTTDRTLKVLVGVITAILVTFAEYQASGVLAPLTLALFIIAIVWPIQHGLQARMPALLALAITMVLTVVVCLGF